MVRGALVVGFLAFLATCASGKSDHGSADDRRCRQEQHEHRLNLFKTWAERHNIPFREKHKRMEVLMEEFLSCDRRHRSAESSNERLTRKGGACEMSKLNLKDRVVLVGNGASVLERRGGASIDAFDEVIRFNNIRVKGFEEIVGSKTTVAFLGSTFEICPCSEWHADNGLKSVECCDDDMAAAFWSNFDAPESLKIISASARIPAFLFAAPSAPRNVRTMQTVWRFQPWPLGTLANEILEELGKYHANIRTRFQPTTVLRNGLYAIMMLIQCGTKPVLAGFDVNYRKDGAYVHHYYPRAVEPVEKLTGENKSRAVEEHQKGYHDFEAEGQVLRELLAAGLISEL
eukprot:jgi/Mesvir1/1209/Mv17696-RA.1